MLQRALYSGLRWVLQMERTKVPEKDFEKVRQKAVAMARWKGTQCERW